MEHFESLYWAPVGVNIVEILKVYYFFPRMVTMGMCIQLYKLVTRYDLFQVLRSLKKDTSLGPNGHIVELFLGYFELLGEDLL